MNYTDARGNLATGVVWSPGPLPGTVWVLPEAGASADMARVVKLDRKSKTWEELSTREVDRLKTRATSTMKTSGGYAVTVDSTRELEVRAAHRQAFNDGRGMSPKDWHAALGFNPADAVRAAETAGVPTLFDDES